ncbi:Hydroxyethylthiazole kinase [Niveomyces insectorum RCEF 264]|uniref:hydroxyethylthiazole kinase n=1 Tax=Niveomyces insectorum RCEF 264 TaxID=1081102 RepID=A0A167QQC0_9HYPO|nr:Hydroxyethylthiazole kinase [Niveomyces insectorum RCEF 264]
MAAIAAKDVDYSVYLVTDATPAVLGPNSSVEAVVEAALRRSSPGSVGIVQLRDKTADARTLLATLARLHAITAAAGAGEEDGTGRRRKAVPLLINDRVDVAAAAMAAGHCEGVHLGQEDSGGYYGGDGGRTQAKTVDGVAVVSAIMGADDPAAAATALAEQVRLGRTRGPTDLYSAQYEREGAAAAAEPAPAVVPSLDRIQAVLRAVHTTTPLSHNMTNLVVQNFAANVALAVGASPIMSNQGAEAADLARLPGSALVVNMGTVTPDSLANYVQAIGAYNAAGRPIILDPVGAGATAVRRAAVRTILQAGYIDVIKGNEGEIQTAYLALLGDDERAGEEAWLSRQQQQRGVDGSNHLDGAARARLGAAPLDVFTAVLAGMVLYERAAERAAASPAVRGPGTFVPAFLDELARCRKLAAAGDMSWLETGLHITVAEEKA